MAEERRDFQDVKELIKSRIDIVQLIGESVLLKRSGQSMKGLCPFHDEKTPSFHVRPASQHYKCFGCGESGDVFSFVMKKESLDFLDAMRLLAERCGVEMPRATARDRRAVAEQKNLHEVSAQVQGFFVEQLGTDAAAVARAYIEERALEPATVRFGIGFAPGPEAAAGGTRWPLVSWFERQGLPVEAGIRIGVLGRSRQGHAYDRFRNRVMFPIHDERGRVVGCGGRILPGFESDTEPKYLNSPESPIFNKRRLLFGLHQARTAKARSLVVMEGYTDVIAAQMAGLDGAVATLGTSLTSDHASLIRRFAPDGVVLLFDGDAAGRRAAERAFHALATEVIAARIALLSDGDDPADLVQRGGRNALDAVLGRAEDALDVFVRLLGERLDLSSRDGKARAVEECRAVLAGIADPYCHSDLLGRLAAALFLTPDLLASGRRRSPARPSPAPAEIPAAAPRGPEMRAREQILAALLCDPGLLADLVESCPCDETWLPDPWHRRLVDDTMTRFTDLGDYPSPADLLARWWTLASGDPDGAQLVSGLEDLAETIAEPEVALRDGVKFLETRLIRADFDRTKEAYRQALRGSDRGRVHQLESELAETFRRLAGSGRKPRS